MTKYLLLTLLLHISLYGSKQIDLNNPNIYKEINLYKNNSLLNPNYQLLNIQTDYDPNNINVNNLLTQPQRDLVEGTFYTQILMIGTVGLLYVMPESVSKWDKNALEEKSLGDRWKDHVKAGPVWDKDDFAINYIGHPVSGAWYYTMARGYGISPEGSFLYSAFLSTVVWEYGYEAFAEIPSWQDLFSTPIIGSLMGEGFYYLEKKIDRNEGKVLNSETLGDISYFLLNPIGNISNGLSNFFDLHTTLRIETYQPRYSMEQQYIYIYQEKPIVTRDQDFGLILTIEF
ncbi:DUF3943 domain-containing protein [Sulfurimonas marina]|uniref:DUF3943 domain-containing protein n=1 Tax=Sulfurimonas marina TaxID=2590551 RepID=A0A7M3V8X6_9BACT|nr:DUF3943 domain-containing protein [Sulfurimonas marina]QOP40209.1 DUF3943 domain-containing protein [Sulfurimonas marina]